MFEGNLKKSKNKFKKNALPPFSNKGWVVNKDLKDVFWNGYEISFFSSEPYKNIRYKLPVSEWAGKTASLSIQKTRGGTPRTSIYWRIGTTYTYRNIYKAGSLEGVEIPSNVDDIGVFVQGEEAGQYYFSGIQLEEGKRSTALDEYTEVSNTNIDKKIPIGANLMPNSDEEKKAVSHEFLQYVDLAPIFDRYGVDQVYSLSLDMRSADTSQQSSIMVYMQNGSSTKHGFIYRSVNVTTEYQRFKFEGLKPSINSLNEVNSWLSFYGTYNSGNMPHVKNVQLELGSVCTPYQTYRSEAVKRIGKGLEFNGEDEYIYRDDAVIDEFEIDLVMQKGNNRYNTLMSLGNQVASRPFHWLFDANENVQIQASKSNSTFEGGLIAKARYGERVRYRVKILSGKIELYEDDELRNTLMGEFRIADESSNRVLSIMTYYTAKTHTNKGTLFSFKGWYNGSLKVHYDFENKHNNYRTAIDHSGNNNDGTIKSNKRPPLTSRRLHVSYPIKKYPFVFRRDSMESLNGKRFSLNQPRVFDGGIAIDGGTKNLFESPNNFDDKNWAKETAITVYPKRVIAPDGSLTSDIISYGSSGTRYFHQLPKSVSGAAGWLSGKSFTISCWMKGAVGGEIVRLEIRTTGGAAKHYSETFNLSNEWKRYSYTANISSDDENTRVGGLFIGSLNSEYHVWHPQFEEGSRASSYTEGVRPDEYLDIPVSFDGQGGSIEIEFEHNNFIKEKMYLFDSNRNRWLLWKPEGADYLQVYTDGRSRFNFPVSSMAEGKNNFRLEWDENSSRGFMNNTLVGSGSHSGKSSATTLYLGRRQTDIDFYNSVFYSVVIKDRYGRVQFRL